MYIVFFFFCICIGFKEICLNLEVGTCGLRIGEVD